MLRSSRIGFVALSVAVLSVTTGRASAEVLFSDNFEIIANGGNDVDNGSDPSTGVLPNTTPLHADIGNYDTDDTNSRVAGYGAAISNPTPAAPNASAPASNAVGAGGTHTGGSHLMRIQAPSGGARNAARFSQPASVPGSTFHLEFDFYASTSVSFGFGSQNRDPFEGSLATGIVNPASARPRQTFQINLVGGAVNVLQDSDNNPATGNAQVSTGLTFTANTFQKIAVDYVLGANQLRLTQTKDVSGTPTTTSVDITSPFLSATDSDFDSSNGLTPLSVSSVSQVDAIFFATGTASSVGFVDNLIATGSAFAGDANHDLTVNALDFNALATNFGVMSNASWKMGDFNADNKVDSFDFAALAANFNTSIAPSPALGSVVPEPATASVLCLAAGLLALRRPCPSRAVHRSV